MASGLLHTRSSRFTRKGLVLMLVVALAPVVAIGGHFGGRNGAVGGISVNAEGVIANVNIDARNALRQTLMKEVKKPVAELNQPVELRMVSLKGLEAALADARDNNLMQIPDEVKYLAGLQRVQYILVVPEENDIVLVGPAEGWKIDEGANVVGVTTGRPVLQLDDLMVALRSTAAARAEGISCSIDPTAEGRRNLQQFLNKERRFGPATMTGMQQALGAQEITLKGVPADSHYARVLVAADYHMKRIAMNLDKSPLASLPGFLDMVVKKNAKIDNLMPRWWLACNYEPLLRSEDGLTWELRGQGVKAMTEDEVIGDDGSVRGTGRKGAVAEQWANLMTEKYDELSGKNAIFGELRNIMDLAVVVALIDKEGLIAKANASFPILTDANSAITSQKWAVPKKVATQCSFITRGRGANVEHIVTASGGVQVDSYGVASKVETNNSVAKVRDKALARSGKPWWWN